MRAAMRGAHWLQLAVCSLLALAAAGQLRLSVIEGSPLVAHRVAAAAAAGAADAAEVVVADAEPGEPLALPHHVCRAAEEGYHAVLTGMEGVSAATEAAAARAGVPLLALGGGAGAAGARREALALCPGEDVALAAARDLCQEKGWQQAVLLHAGSARPAAALAPDDTQLRLLVRQIPPADDAMLRDLLLVLKKEGQTKFVVWGDARAAAAVLDAAQRVGLLAAAHAYIFLSLELHTLPLHDYSYGGANITGFVLFEPNSETEEAVAAWRAACAERPECADGDVDAGALTAADAPTGLLLAQAAARIAAEALLYLQLPDLNGAGAAACDRGTGAFHADTLLNYLRSTEHPDGLAWDADGGRHDVVLHVVELALGGRLEVVGRWRRRDGVTWQRPLVEARAVPDDSMINRTFNILIAINKPYVMRKESLERLSGNDQYEGFCIELFERLADILNFNYTFIEHKGSYDQMLDKLMANDTNYHFAITDLTITADREKKVDFTTPFMNLGISILFRKPKPPEPKFFNFLEPFSTGVWVWLAVAYIGTSLVLYVVGRLCPEEWQNPYPCIEEPVALENQFTLANALWFNLGAVLLQGSEIAPVAYGSRTVASVWWMFALVIVSSYTANLATLLAKKTSTEVISNVDELARNEVGIEYGAKAGGATYTFFQHSQSDLFKIMFEHLKSHPNPDSNEKGIEMVMNSSYKYAFLMESTSIEYEVERNCAVTQVGELLDNKGYGIAMRKFSPFRQALNLALLRLQEQGRLREMKHVWWEERHGGGACKADEQAEAERLDMKSFIGLFVVLIVGCALGVLLSCADLAALAWREPRDPARSFRHNFAHELSFVFHIDLSAKPLQGPLFESKEPSSQSSAASELEEAGEAGEADEAEAEREAEAPAPEEPEAPRNESALSARRRRRRSSMHNASVRLARHARD